MTAKPDLFTIVVDRPNGTVGVFDVIYPSWGKAEAARRIYGGDRVVGLLVVELPNGGTE